MTAEAVPGKATYRPQPPELRSSKRVTFRVDMRFFTRELHERVNSDDMRAGLDEFERRWATYLAQLAGLRGRLSAASFSFFSDHSSHDATLLSVAFGDDVEETHGRKRTDIPACSQGRV